MGTYLSSKLRDMGDGMLLHWCPGCKTRHYVDTLEPNGSGAIWTWDGNAAAPPRCLMTAGTCWPVAA